MIKKTIFVVKLGGLYYSKMDEKDVVFSPILMRAYHFTTMETAQQLIDCLDLKNIAIIQKKDIVIYL